MPLVVESTSLHDGALCVPAYVVRVYMCMHDYACTECCRVMRDI